MPSQFRIRGYSHLLGECSVSLVAAPEIAKKAKKRFPASLHGVPFLMPTLDTVLRSSLDRWLDGLGVRPVVASEFADNALLMEFGERGGGVFAVPSVIEQRVCKTHGVRRVGTADGIVVRFYAITVEKKITHPAVAAITRSARQELFAG
jgi:LysR family transcriptional activator of nhaA